MEIKELTRQLSEKIDRLELEQAADILKKEMMSNPNVEVDMSVLELSAQLALLGCGPLTDALRYIEKNKNRDVEEDDFQAGIAATLQRLLHEGAVSVASELLAYASKRWPGLALWAHYETLIEEGVVPEPYFEFDEITDALKTGERQLVKKRLKQCGENAFLKGKKQIAALSWRMMAALAEEENCFEESIMWHKRVVQKFPNSDLGFLSRLNMGKDALAIGNTDLAQEIFDGLRDSTRERELFFYRTLHEQSAAFSKLLGIRQDSETHQQMDWLALSVMEDRPALPGLSYKRSKEGQSLLADIYRHFNLAIDMSVGEFGFPTLAHLRWQLSSRDFVTSRAYLNKSTVVTALENGGIFIIAEERPIDTGFLWVVGIEKNMNLLKMIDPGTVGFGFETIEQQKNKGELFGNSGLIVWGRGETGRKLMETVLESVGETDGQLALLDALDLDENGQVPPRSHVASMAKKVVEVLPDIPVVHRKMGEALIEKVQAGEIELGSGGAFEKWLCDTRVKFPDAEWPFQLYGQALGIQKRFVEAGIAWRDAVIRDPLDYRNYLGKASADESIGDVDFAMVNLRWAAKLIPGLAEIYDRLADNALQREANEDALLYSSMAVSLDRTADEGMQLTWVTALELNGKSESACRELNVLVEKEPANPSAVQRLMRYHLNQGNFEAAFDLARQNVAAIPGAPAVWRDAATAAYMSGDIDQTLNLAFEGIQRCGPEESLTEIAADAIGYYLEKEQQSEPANYFVRLVGGQPGELEPLIKRLLTVGNQALALQLLDQLGAAFEGDINLMWMRYRLLVRDDTIRRERRADLFELLIDINRGAPGFVYPAVLLADKLIQNGDVQKAYDVLTHTDEQRAPALVWFFTAKVFEKEGDSDKAAAVRERITGLPIASCINDIAFLRGYFQVESALEMLTFLEQAELEEAQLDIMIGRIYCLIAQKKYVTAYDTLQKAEAFCNNGSAQGDGSQQNSPVIDDDLIAYILSKCAEETPQWERLEALIVKGIEQMTLTTGNNGEVWPKRGLLAGIRLILGDESEREKLLETASCNAVALKALVSVEKRMGHAMFKEDFELLQSKAPGLAALVEMESVQ